MPEFLAWTYEEAPDCPELVLWQVLAVLLVLSHGGITVVEGQGDGWSWSKTHG